MQYDLDYGETGPQATGYVPLGEASGWSGPPYLLANALLSALPAPTAVLDRQATIVAVNAPWKRLAREHGVPGLAEDSLGLSYMAVCRQASAPSSKGAKAATAGLQAVLKGTQPLFTLEYACLSPTAQRWFLLQATPLSGPEGGAVVSHIDITERKQAAEEHARLVAREQAAREEAERMRAEADAAHRAAKAPAQKVRRLQLVTDAALHHLALEDLLPNLLDRIRRVMAVDNASILLMTEEEQELTLRMSRGLLQSEPVNIPLGKGVAGRIAATRQPMVVDDLSAMEVFSPELRQLRSLAGVPLLEEGRLIGVLHVATLAPRCFAQSDIQFLELVGDRIAPALEHARLHDVAQAAFRQAEERAGQLQAIIDSMTDSVLVFDRELHVVQTNTAYAEMFGFDPRSAPVPITLWETAQLLQLGDMQVRRYKKKQELFSQILRGETFKGPSAVDVQVQTLHGQDLVVSASGAPVHDAQGRIIGGVAVFRDVTQRRQLERALAARANELAALIESMTDAVLVCDREGRIVRINRAYRDLIGVDRFPDYNAMSPDDRARLLNMRDEQGHPVMAPVSRLLQGEVLQGPTAADLRLQTLTGRELQVNVSGTPVRDSDGRITGAMAVIRDVSERREVERHTREALHALIAMARALVGIEPSTDEGAPEGRTSQVARHLAELTQRVLGCASVGIFALEPDTDVLHPLAVAGWVPADEEAWGASYQRLPRLSEQFGPSVIACLRRDQVVVVHAPNLERPTKHNGDASSDATAYTEGPPLTNDTWLIAPMSAGGRLVGLLRVDYGWGRHAYTEEELGLVGAVSQMAALVVERDRFLWEREQARADELAARAISQRMDEFLAVASHDLRQPVQSSLGYVELAARRFQRLAAAATPPSGALATQFQAVEGDLARANTSLEHVRRLVLRLFTVSRIRTGQFDLERTHADLAAIVQEAVEDQRMSAPSRIIHLDLPAEQPVLVVADTVSIGEVVTNYLTNALHYSPEDRPVHVALRIEDRAEGRAEDRAEGQRVWVSVRDEGRGIPAADQERIWARFQRPREGEQQNSGEAGLGLGLYICREIVERHGGQVGVDSIVEQGSTFWFTLPRAERAMDGDQTAPA
jgi:PAS domain S-box-containing protein